MYNNYRQDMMRIDAVNNVLTYSANIIYTDEYTILIYTVTHDFGYSENDHHP